MSFNHHGRPARGIAAAALSAYVLAGCTSTPPKPAQASASPPVKAVPTRPGADFPNPESFYPLEARRLAIEGTAVVHFCTDEAGRLSAMPTVVQSSGNAYLDSAALLVASAGNGHYIPATRTGVAVAGCSRFGVRFVMFRDPRWPTIANHVISADARFALRVRELYGDWRMPAPPATTPTVTQQLEVLRGATRKASGALEPTLQLFNDYLTSIDEASSGPDIPETERRAFLADWTPKRVRLREAFDDAAVALRGMIVVMNDMIAFLETLPPDATRDTLTAPQRARLDGLTNRGRALYERVEATRRLVQERPGDKGAEGQSDDPEAGAVSPR